MGPGMSLHYGGGCAYQKPVGTPPVQTCEKYYPDDPAFEIQYAPFGVNSGLCLATTALPGERVTLQPCGVSAKTVWVADTYDSPSTLYKGYVPLINGSNTNFSQPFVLTYPTNSYPTDKPRPQLVVTNITGFSHGFPPGPQLGTVDSNQLWGGKSGVLS
jgi:hypothetical protein